MILRLSQKLSSKIKAGTLGELPLDENPYADWSSHLFVVGRTHYILLSNTASLYSCVMPAKGITNGSQLIERSLHTIREFMDADGLSTIHRESVDPASGSVRFAKALNRKVTGSMNELVMAAKYAMETGDMSLRAVGIDINGLLLSAIATKEDRGYGRPREAFLNLLKRSPE